MNKQGKLDELDKKIIYYYRNNFSSKRICELTGKPYTTIKGRMNKLYKNKLLKRWWNE